MSASASASASDSDSASIGTNKRKVASDDDGTVDQPQKKKLAFVAPSSDVPTIPDFVAWTGVASDYTLVVGAHMIPTHKFMLCHHSVFLRRIIEDCKETSYNVMTSAAPELQIHTVVSFLWMIYTALSAVDATQARKEVTDENCDALAALAHRWDCKFVGNVCAAFFVDRGRCQPAKFRAMDVLLSLDRHRIGQSYLPDLCAAVVNDWSEVCAEKAKLLSSDAHKHISLISLRELGRSRGELERSRGELERCRTDVRYRINDMKNELKQLRFEYEKEHNLVLGLTNEAAILRKRLREAGLSGDWRTNGADKEAAASVGSCRTGASASSSAQTA